MNNATCTDYLTEFVCNCKNGYNGTLCEIGMYKRYQTLLYIYSIEFNKVVHEVLNTMYINTNIYAIQHDCSSPSIMTNVVTHIYKCEIL